MYNIKELKKGGVTNLFKKNAPHFSPYIEGFTDLSSWQMYRIYNKCLKNTNLGIFIVQETDFIDINGEFVFIENYEYDNIKEFKYHIEELSKKDNESLFLISTIGYLRKGKKIILRGKIIEDYKEYNFKDFDKHFKNRRKRVIYNLLG